MHFPGLSGTEERRRVLVQHQGVPQRLCFISSGGESSLLETCLCLLFVFLFGRSLDKTLVLGLWLLKQIGGWEGRSALGSWESHWINPNQTAVHAVTCTTGSGVESGNKTKPKTLRLH